MEPYHGLSTDVMPLRRQRSRWLADKGRRPSAVSAVENCFMRHVALLATACRYARQGVFEFCYGQAPSATETAEEEYEGFGPATRRVSVPMAAEEEEKEDDVWVQRQGESFQAYLERIAQKCNRRYTAMQSRAVPLRANTYDEVFLKERRARIEIERGDLIRRGETAAPPYYVFTRAPGRSQPSQHPSVRRAYTISSAVPAPPQRGEMPLQRMGSPRVLRTSITMEEEQ